MMTTTRRLSIGPACLGLLCCALLAGEQQLSIQTPDAVYNATTDDSLPRRMKVEVLPVFSPLVDTSPPLNPYLTGVGDPFGKLMLSPKLEDCRHGDPDCPPASVNNFFLRNAQSNLQKARAQIRTLKQERLPQPLEPVRRFLLDSLTTTTRMEEARFEYVQTGRVAPLKAMLGDYCSTIDPELMRKLEEAASPEARRELSWHDWYNAVWQCYAIRTGKYPSEAWKQFLQQFHVRESVESKLEQ